MNFPIFCYSYWKLSIKANDIYIIFNKLNEKFHQNFESLLCSSQLFSSVLWFFVSSSCSSHQLLYIRALRDKRLSILIQTCSSSWSSSGENLASSSSFFFGSQSPAFLISNIGSLISIKLGNHNYLLWKFNFLPVLRANGLVGFVDGTNVYPSEYILDFEGNPTKKNKI